MVFKSHIHGAAARHWWWSRKQSARRHIECRQISRWGEGPNQRHELGLDLGNSQSDGIAANHSRKHEARGVRTGRTPRRMRLSWEDSMEVRGDERNAAKEQLAPKRGFYVVSGFPARMVSGWITNSGDSSSFALPCEAQSAKTFWYLPMNCSFV
jgi:hypothetical protein